MPMENYINLELLKELNHQNIIWQKRKKLFLDGEEISCPKVNSRDGSNLYLIWSAWFDLKIYLVPSFAWFGLIWRFKYLGLIWLEQFENCKCLTWLGLVFKYLKKAWAWSFDFLKGLIWLEKYKPESNLQPRIIITENLWIFYFCILLDVILRSICNFNISFFK